MDFSFVRSRGYSWRAEVEEALQTIDQGSVLRDVPLAYAANGMFAVLPQSVVLGERTGGVNLGCADAIVTSQTCDIRGPGGKKTALLTVAPVYPLRELNPNMTLADIAKSAYLAHVSAAQFSEEIHVVDLRFEVAVEKSIAVGRDVFDGFATPEERTAFSKKLGEYRRRGAFDPLIESDLIKPLEDLFSESISADDVYEVRVLADPSVSRADSVRLIVVCESGADTVAIRSIVAAWYDGVRESGTELNLLPLIVDGADQLTIEQVRGSVPIYFRKLSSDAPEA